MVFKSIDLSAFFSLITPVMIRASAPTQPMTQSFMPILSSKIIPKSVRIKIINDIICFHLGTFEKSFCSSYELSVLPCFSGRNLYPINAKYRIPAISIGSPTFAYSKNPKLSPISPIADCAMRFPGAPMRDKFPPMAAAKTSGIRSLDLEYPDFAAIPITTGMRTAAVPVFESTPLISPTITIIAMISCLSVLAKCVTTPPILFAIPVSNNAPPTINIATKRITLLSINPEKAVFQSSTPVITRPTHTIMDVTPSGIFSHTNITTANNKNKSVIVAGLISFSSSV